MNHQHKGESRRPRVLVADDRAAVIERVIRELEPEFEIVGSAADGRTAVEAVRKLSPDVPSGCLRRLATRVRRE